MNEFLQLMQNYPTGITGVLVFVLLLFSIFLAFASVGLWLGYKAIFASNDAVALAQRTIADGIRVNSELSNKHHILGMESAKAQLEHAQSVAKLGQEVAKIRNDVTMKLDDIKASMA